MVPDPFATENRKPIIGQAMSERYLFGPLTPALAALLPESEQRRQRVKRELIAAGYHQPHIAENLAALRYLGLMVPLIAIAGLVLLVPGSVSPAAVGLMLVLPGLGWIGPRLAVRWLAHRRLNEIERGLPILLDMLQVCIPQGLPLRKTLDRIVRELACVSPALAGELRVVIDQSRIGSLELALENLCERIELPGLRSLASLLMEADRIGPGICEVFSNDSHGLRESLRRRSGENAAILFSR